jgi:hypothetical protein
MAGKPIVRQLIYFLEVLVPSNWSYTLEALSFG